MNSIFRNSPVRLNNENQNNVMARKPGNSTRKPLADRKVEQQSAQKTFQQFKNIQENYFHIDTCSYKDVPDNYNDLLGPAELSNFSNINFANIQKTPPPERRIFERFEPELIEDNYKFLLDDKSYDFPQDFQLFDIGDPPLPEIDF